MNLNNTGGHLINLSNICEGCLSADRQITLIKDEESKRLFYEILHDFEYLNRMISICWECSSIVKKILTFKNQVRQARNHLRNYVHNQPLTSLSKLSYRNPKVLDVTEQWDRTCQQHDKKTQLTFIKIEEGVEEGEAEGCFVDEEVDDTSGSFVVEKDLKAVLKSDPEHCNTLIGSKSSVINITRNTDDFDESDEEPLKYKQKEVENGDVKQGRGRKRKEDGPKVDRRKHPGPKKEKPPGVIHNPRVAKKLQQLNVPSGQLEMVVLSWDEVEDERRRALESVVFTRHEYRCYDCVLGFNHRFKLDNHMKKHHPSSGDKECGVCRVRCRGAHALCAHRRRHRVRWRCCACGAAWSRAAVAADHVARAHGAPAPTHTCSVCGHCEPSLSKLRVHVKSHGERQKCDLCGKTFRDKTSLRTHLFIHKGEKEYACPRCGKRFLFKKAMELHQVTHDAPAHLYCHQCDMNFKNKMSYYQHVKYNLKHIDPAKLKFACHLCDKKFVKAARLQEHNLAVHLKATPVHCTVQGCNFVCSTRPVLRTHLRMVHRNARALRNHVCDTCGKAYTTKKTLEGHMRSHTGERPFRCARCPSAFGYEAALYNHNKLVHLKAKLGRSRGPVGATPTWPPAPTVPTSTDLA